MAEILRLTYGIFPKTEKLRVRIGRWERKILPARELEDLIREETEAFQKLARENRISAFTDPLFNWYDIFRPMSLLSGGIELGPLTRYGETNTFFRLPEVRGILSLDGNPSEFRELHDNPPLPLYHVDQGADQLAFVPGPVTFFHFCGNVAGESFGSFSEQLGKFYSQVLTKFNFKRFLVFESVPLGENDLGPFYKSVDPEKTILITAGKLEGKALASAGRKFHSVVTSDANDNIKSATQYSAIPGLALIDAHNTKLEDPKAITKRANDLEREYGIGRLYVTHTDYLDFFPRDIAEKKIQVMGRIGE